MSRFTLDSARAFLIQADVFYYGDVESEIAGLKTGYKDKWTEEKERQWREEISQSQQTLNMNDTWGWALAWGEKVPDDKLIEVAGLFWSYGWAGLLYWVSEQHSKMRSEFHDVNRRVDFVRHEQEFQQRTPGSSAQAYTPYSYTLGGPSIDNPGETHARAD